MYRIALNVAISFYRRESARGRQVMAADEALVESMGETPADSEEALYRWIGELDPLNRALVLLYLDGNSYREIPGILGISESNAATKIGRIKETFRQQAGAKHGTR